LKRGLNKTATRLDGYIIYCLKLLSALSSPFAKYPISGFEQHSVPSQPRLWNVSQHSTIYATKI
jgi:hypothetical protein